MPAAEAPAAAFRFSALLRCGFSLAFRQPITRALYQPPTAIFFAAFFDRLISRHSSGR